MEQKWIRVKGARQHNLKGVDLEIPRNQLVVLTGVSGSGKSSFAFNTLYAEGQRRYMECLSSYARQFLETLEKPAVDSIEGLSPAIAIEQRQASSNPRSTVATSTEIYPFLRILFSIAGIPHDPQTGEALTRFTPTEMAKKILQQEEGTRVLVLSPFPERVKKKLPDALEKARRRGFLRVRYEGEVLEIEALKATQVRSWKPEKLQLVIDRLVLREGIRSRLTDSIETALREDPAQVVFSLQKKSREAEWEDHAFPTHFCNPKTGFILPPILPSCFSFNSHVGACSRCHGLGMVEQPDPSLLVINEGKTLEQGALVDFFPDNGRKSAVQLRKVSALVAEHNEKLSTPFREFPASLKKILLDYLCKEIPVLLEKAKGVRLRRRLRKLMSQDVCPSCRGKRLKEAFLAIKLPHKKKEALSIDAFCALSIKDAAEWIGGLALAKNLQKACEDLLREIKSHLGFLQEIGLNYLTLDRASNTLSGGESQRIKLASQLGSSLSGILYVLDEPSIGLHPRDNARLIATLKKLRDLGNSVLVVEHDAEMIQQADYVVDFGPRAGVHGGEVVFSGTWPPTKAQCKAHPHSQTIAFLTEKKAGVLKDTKPNTEPQILIKGAAEHNLKNIDVCIPLGAFVCITGVSGSGKSTLIENILYPALQKKLYHSKVTPGAHDRIEGLEHIRKAAIVDQSPIGQSPRSNPATYSGCFQLIRDLFAQTPLARQRGYQASRFSFNMPGGRCEACKGDGFVRLEMHFLPDAFVPCERCQTQRYNAETLEILYRGQSIADVLSFSIEKAVDFFSKHPVLSHKLQMLCDIGLGYLRLGQAANTLSGGEAQRLKLASYLSKSRQKDTLQKSPVLSGTLLLLDEPTTGLHMADIEVLLKVFSSLQSQGHSLVVIEHNVSLISQADWVIDLGPEGGAEGGQVIAEGTPKQIAENAKSFTGNAL